MRNRILAVDDDTGVLGAVTEALEPENVVQTAQSGQGALSLLESFQPDAAIVDYRLPDLTGEALIRNLRVRHPALPVIVLSAATDVDCVVRMMREGSVDYLSKPFDAVELQGIVGRAVGGPMPSPTSPCESLLGISAAMTAFNKRLAAETRLGRHLLIGAELGFDMVSIARYMAGLIGPRTPLMVLQDGEIAEIPAAFPPAPRGIVLCSLAGHGVPVVVRALEIARWRGTIGAGLIQMVIAAPQSVPDGDALLRMSSPVSALLVEHPGIVSLRLPSLRERPEDVSLGLRYFIEKHARRAGRPIRSITLEAMDLLLSYRWPGNIREMDGVVEEIVRQETRSEIDATATARLDAGAFIESACKTSCFTGESLSDGLRRLDRLFGAGRRVGVA